MSTSPIITLTQGSPTNDMIPKQLIETATEEALSDYSFKMLQYGNVWGFTPLREAIAAEYNFPVKQVIIGNGSIALLAQVAAYCLKAGDVVLVENPTYFRAKIIFETLGATVIGVTQDADGINLEEFEAKIKQYRPKMFYIVPDFHNPTGVTTSFEKRQKIAELAQAYDFLIHEDSAYYSLRYEGKNIPQIRELAPEHTLTSGSFSKLICPSLRTGWLLMPEKISQDLATYIENRIISPNYFSEGIIAKLISRPSYQEHLALLKKTYLERRKNALAILEREFEGIEARWNKPEGGYFIGLWLERTDVTLWDAGAQFGYKIINGDEFHVGTATESFVRLPFCSAQSDDFEEGIKRLVKAFKSLSAVKSR